MAEPVRIERIELGGIPVYWSEPRGELPFLAGMVFRVGWCDETLKSCGLSHLVEHMALPAAHRPGLEFNGVVSNTSTYFWFSGDRDGSITELAATASALADLPLERLDSERRILSTEAASRSAALVPLLMSLRFGPVGHGLVHYNEFALHWVAPDDVTAWVRERFTRDNVCLYFAGTPPQELELALPAGTRLRPPEPAPIDYVRYPCVFRGGPSGTIAVALVVKRSYELMTALRVLELRLREALRYQHGMTYDVGWSYEILTAEDAHVVVWADALEANLDRVRNVLLTVLDDLALTGPTQAELEVDRRGYLEAVEDPLASPGRLWGDAHDELLGLPLRPFEEEVEQQLAVTSETAAQALAVATGSMLLCTPSDASAPGGRFVEYPLESPFHVTGRRHKRRKRLFREPGGFERELVVGDEGITLVTTDWTVTVPFAQCEVVLHLNPSGRGLWSRDGFYVYVDPSIWRNGDEVVTVIDAALPSDLVVPIEPEAAPYADSDLAQGAQAFADARWDDAIRLLSSGLEREPHHPLLWVQLGFAHEARSQLRQALQAADEALQRDPRLLHAHRLRARALHTMGRYEDAAAAARAALELDPADLDALTDFAWIAADARPGEEALRAARRATELFPGAGTAWYALSCAADAAGDRAGAEEALRKAVEVEPEYGMWHNNLGWHLMGQGETAEAIRLFDRALKLDPKNDRAPWNRALALQLHGRAREGAAARRAWAEAKVGDTSRQLEEDPENVDARWLLVASLLELGRLDEVRREVEALAENARAVGRTDRLFNAALTASGLQDEARATQWFEEALGLDDGSSDAPYYRAFFGVLRGDAAAAAAGAEALAGDTVHLARDAAGYAALAAGDAAEAKEQFTATLERLPLRCCSHAWRGVSCARLAEPEEAAAMLARAKTLCVYGGVHCPSIRRLEQELGGV